MYLCNAIVFQVYSERVFQVSLYYSASPKGTTCCIWVILLQWQSVVSSNLCKYYVYELPACSCDSCVVYTDAAWTCSWLSVKEMRQCLNYQFHSGSQALLHFESQRLHSSKDRIVCITYLYRQYIMQCDHCNSTVLTATGRFHQCDWLHHNTLKNCAKIIFWQTRIMNASTAGFNHNQYVYRPQGLLTVLLTMPALLRYGRSAKLKQLHHHLICSICAKVL